MKSSHKRALAHLGVLATLTSSLTAVGALAGGVAANAFVPATTNTYDFPTFAPGDATLFALNGGATVGGTDSGVGVLQLTQATTPSQRASAWGKAPVDTTKSFASNFVFDLNTGNTSVNDGFTFTLQGAGTSALGGCGDYIGLGQGSTDPCDFASGIGTSVAFGFRNGHALFVKNGDTDVPADDVVATPTIDVNTNANKQDPKGRYEAWVDYDAVAKSLKLSFAKFTAAGAAPAKPAALMTETADLSSIVGSTGYAGFTGSTGTTGGTTDALVQDINSWDFREVAAAPSGLTATPVDYTANPPAPAAGASEIDLAWTQVTDTGSAASGTAAGVVSYDVYRAVGAGAFSKIGNVLDSATPTYQDTTGKGGVAYNYQVVAVNAIGDSAPSNTAPATAALTKPDVPTGFTATTTPGSPNAGQGKVDLAWTAPVDTGGSPLTGYTIQRTGTSSLPITISDGTATSFQDTGLSAGTYHYTIVATNDQGDSPAVDAPNDAVVTTLASAPGSTVANAPSDLTAHFANGATVLTWTAPSDNGGSTITGYNVYRDGDTLLNTDGPVDALTFTDENPATGGDHTYTVRAVNGSGEGPASNGATVFVPAAPSGIDLSRDGNGQLQLNWAGQTVPSENSSSISYVVYLTNVDGTNDCSQCKLLASGAFPGDWSTPDSNGSWTVGNITSAVIENVPSGNWQARVVPIGSTPTEGEPNTAEGPSTLSDPTGAIHTVRYVSALFGDDSTDFAQQNDCTVANSSDGINAIAESTACASITQALALAGAGDEILVGHGTYNEGTNIFNCLFGCSKPKNVNFFPSGSYGNEYEGLAITQPVQLIADPSNSTDNFPGATGDVVINASGFNNGLVVDMGDSSGGGNFASGSVNPDVLVKGFTIQNANAEGLLALNSDAIRIEKNVIQDNDKGSSDTNIQDNLGECTADPQTNTPGDCGEGLHLDGVTRSVITGNTIQGNSGGMLVSDGLASFLTNGEEASNGTWGNTISSNKVLNNTLDCGITVAGHEFGVFNQAQGIFDNIISNNTSSGNGTEGEGAGVLLAVGAPADAVYQNQIRGNVLEGDGLPGVTIHAHEALAYMDDNVVEANRITSTGIGGVNGVTGDPDAGAIGTTGIVVLGLPADPIGGTIIQDNVISAVHNGIVLNEASQNLSGNSFNGVSVPLTLLPKPQNVYALRGSNGHLQVNTGTVSKVTDLGGALASAPAVTAVPVWDANAFGPDFGYWTGELTPEYAARLTNGHIAVRSNTTGWQNVATPLVAGKPMPLVGSPSIVSSMTLDNGYFTDGSSLLGIGVVSTAGDLWVESIEINKAHQYAGVISGWHKYGHPSGTTLTGSPALVSLFFANKAYVPAKNGSVYSLAFDPFTVDWVPGGNPWVKSIYKARSVAASSAADGYRSALTFTAPNGSKVGYTMSTVTFVNGVAGKPAALLTAKTATKPASNLITLYPTTGVAVATNGITVAFADLGHELNTRGAISRDLESVVVGGVAATALN
jgi:hypothetical protein